MKVRAIKQGSTAALGAGWATFSRPRTRRRPRGSNRWKRPRSPSRSPRRKPGRRADDLLGDRAHRQRAQTPKGADDLVKSSPPEYGFRGAAATPALFSDGVRPWPVKSTS